MSESSIAFSGLSYALRMAYFGYDRDDNHPNNSDVLKGIIYGITNSLATSLTESYSDHPANFLFARLIVGPLAGIATTSASTMIGLTEEPVTPHTIWNLHVRTAKFGGDCLEFLGTTAGSISKKCFGDTIGQKIEVRTVSIAKNTAAIAVPILTAYLFIIKF